MNASKKKGRRSRGGKKLKNKDKKHIFDLNSKKLGSEEGLTHPWDPTEKYQANFNERTYRLGLHSAKFPLSRDLLHTFCHEPLAASLQRTTALTLTVVTKQHILLVIDPCNAPCMKEIWAQDMCGQVRAKVSSVDDFKRELGCFDCSRLEVFDTKVEKFQDFLRNNQPIKERLSPVRLSEDITLRDYLSLVIDGLFIGFYVADPDSRWLDCRHSCKCVCGEKFPDLDQLADHFFDGHKEFWEIAEDDFGLKTSQCRNCGYTCVGCNHVEKIHAFYRHYLEKHLNKFLKPAEEGRLKKTSKDQIQKMITGNMLEPIPLDPSPRTQGGMTPSLNAPVMVAPATCGVAWGPQYVAGFNPLMVPSGNFGVQTPGYGYQQVAFVPMPQVYQAPNQPVALAYVAQPSYVPNPQPFQQPVAYPQPPSVQLNALQTGYVPSQQSSQQAQMAALQFSYQGSTASTGCPISSKIAPLDRQVNKTMDLPDNSWNPRELPEDFPPYGPPNPNKVEYLFVRYSYHLDTPKTSDQRTKWQTARSFRDRTRGAVELKCSQRCVIESGTVIRTRYDGWSMTGERTDRSVQWPRQDDNQIVHRSYKGQKCKLEISKKSEAAKKRRMGRAEVDADGLITPGRIHRDEIASDERFSWWIGSTIDTSGIQLPSPMAR